MAAAYGETVEGCLQDFPYFASPEAYLKYYQASHSLSTQVGYTAEEAGLLVLLDSTGIKKTLGKAIEEQSPFVVWPIPAWRAAAWSQGGVYSGSPMGS